MKTLFNMTKGAALRPENEKNEALRRRLQEAAGMEADVLLESLGTTAGGLEEDAVRLSREEHGANVLPHRRKEPLARRLFGAFINPFTVVLLALAVISVFTEIIFAAPGDESYATVLIITAMVLISGRCALCRRPAAAMWRRGWAACCTPPPAWSGPAAGRRCRWKTSWRAMWCIFAPGT